LDDGSFAPRRDAETWRDWGCRQCVERAAQEQFESADWFLGPLRPPHSIGEGAVRVRLLKWARCGQWHGPRWYRGPRLEAQKVLVEREDVPILCLTRQASHGLDLSFLTHVVLLEPIRDSALLEQVVSCVEINKCIGCTAALAPLNGEEPTSPRHRAGVASMAWRTTR